MLLNGRYKIDHKIGQGGFGDVYLATDEHLHGRRVVVKILREESRSDPWFQKKFRQEIEALARIDHPGVVGVLDFGETTDGELYLVMQYVDGVTLRDILQPEGLDLTRAAALVTQIAQALTAAHEKGVYHRDLKPGNIMLQRLSEAVEYVKLIDFGIATVKATHSKEETEETRIAGTPNYLAPEQLMGRPSAASDIYALGVIAHEMVTGRLPFTANTPYALLELQRQGPATPPREFRPEIPEGWERAILRALAFDSKDRFARAVDLAQEFVVDPHIPASDFAGAETQNPPAAGNPKVFDPTVTAVRSPPPTVSVKPGSAAAERAATAPHSDSLEISHILFMDLVDFSTLPLDHQTAARRQLQQVVTDSKEFRRARNAGQLVARPTGDGFALVFSGSPERPVRCAVEIASALHENPSLRLRMGIHSGAVYRTSDIYSNPDVTGDGINLAQRVMDCANPGQILISESVASVLRGLTEWRDFVHDLGEHRVKHDVLLHLYNLCTSEAGSADWPRKLSPPPTDVEASPNESTWQRRAPLAAGIAAVVTGVAWFAFTDSFTGDASIHPETSVQSSGSGAAPGDQPEPQFAAPSAESKLGEELSIRDTNLPGLSTRLTSGGKVLAVPEADQRVANPNPAPRPAAWPMVQGNPGRTGLATVLGPGAPRVRWSTRLGGQLRGSPVIGADGTVYVGSTNRTLYALREGEIYWSAPLTQPVLSSPRIGPNGTIEVATQGGPKYYVGADGQIQSTSDKSGAGNEAAQSPEGTVYRAQGSTLSAEGDAPWQLDLGEPLSTPPSTGGDGSIYVGSELGSVFSIDRYGKLAWTYRASAKIATGVAISSENNLYFGCFDRNLYCIRNGELRWKFAAGGPIQSAPVVDRSGSIYFGSDDGDFYALDNLGRLAWKIPLGNQIRASAAFDHSGRLYVAVLHGVVVCISD